MFDMTTVRRQPSVDWEPYSVYSHSDQEKNNG